MVHVGKIADLRILHLHRTRVTDSGLEQLKDLTGLEELLVSETAVTDDGVQQLNQALPNCSIFYSPRFGGRDAVNPTSGP